MSRPTIQVETPHGVIRIQAAAGMLKCSHQGEVIHREPLQTEDGITAVKQMGAAIVAGFLDEKIPAVIATRNRKALYYSHPRRYYRRTRQEISANEVWCPRCRTPMGKIRTDHTDEGPVWSYHCTDCRFTLPAGKVVDALSDQTGEEAKAQAEGTAVPELDLEESLNQGEWIGVDFDGTLALYKGWQGPTVLGDPVPEMLERVLAWLDAGQDVRIFTARAEDDEMRNAIQQWCLAHLGQILPVTNRKDRFMKELWDDKARRVEENTGRVACGLELLVDISEELPVGGEPEESHMIGIDGFQPEIIEHEGRDLLENVGRLTASGNGNGDAKQVIEMFAPDYEEAGLLGLARKPDGTLWLNIGDWTGGDAGPDKKTLQEMKQEVPMEIVDESGIDPKEEGWKVLFPQEPRATHVSAADDILAEREEEPDEWWEEFRRNVEENNWVKR